MASTECQDILKHLNRIQGQITALKEYITEYRSCDDVAHLLKSITTSFASVRSEIVAELLTQQLAPKGKLLPKQREHIRSIVSVLQK
jgi:DNA-binding FrmR family transcriptional regulator